MKKQKKIKTKNHHNVEETGIVNVAVIAMDLDSFGEIVRKAGLSEYSPNIITAELTHLIEWFVNKHNAVVLYGLDSKRGTEESVLEVICPDINSILKDLDYIRRKIENIGKASGTGATLSIGIAMGYTDRTVSRIHKRRDIKKYPLTLLAMRALKQAKKKGGNQIYLL